MAVAGIEVVGTQRRKCMQLGLYRYSTRKMHTSRARLPKKLTFEPGDYVLKSSRRNIRYVQRP